MKAHWLYLKYVLRHKWHVFWAGIALGVPIHRLILHDWTKFLPSEWFAYVAYFYGPKCPHPTRKISLWGEPLMEVPENVKVAFDHAWNHHQKHNRHHWQWWLLSPDNPRPNFWDQSYDGGMTHCYISDSQGKRAAVVYDKNIEWLADEDFNLTMRLVADLKNTPVALEMRLSDAKEMLADWVGAGKALGGEPVWEWYSANKDKMFLHPATRAWVENQLQRMQKGDNTAMLLGFSPQWHNPFRFR